jgi:hypothetical protein
MPEGMRMDLYIGEKDEDEKVVNMFEVNTNEINTGEHERDVETRTMMM